MSMSPVLGNLTRLKTRFFTRSWNPAVVGIPVLISGFIMIASLKYFSGKTISLVLI